MGAAYHENVSVASRIAADDRRFVCDATVMLDQDDRRVVLALSTGCATTHCRMTPAEARRLGNHLLNCADAIAPQTEGA